MDLELERHDGTTFIDCTKTISEYVDGADWRVRANSNSTYSNASLVNNTAGKVVANYWLDAVYSPEEGAAHREGKYHIHDLDCLTPYCFTGDTRVVLLDGTTPTFTELVEKYGNGEYFWVISRDKNGNIVPGKAHNPRLVKKDAELIKITISGGAEIICTPDHEFMLRDGSYKQAKNLRIRESLMPYYSSVNRYIQVTDAKLGIDDYLHRIVGKWKAGNDLDGKAVHHINGNKLDNRPENIEIMQDSEHRSIEVRKTMRTDTWKKANNARVVEYNKSDEKRKSISKLASDRKRDTAGRFYNHTVIKREILTYKEDVYCLTVDEHENFALKAGVFVHNCAGWNLRKLLDEGFNGVRSRVNAKAPAHLQSAMGQMANFLGILQSEWAGAQAFSSFDTFLAPYVFKDKLEYTAVKDLVTSFVYNLNVPSRWGQSPFTNVTIDWAVPDDLKDQMPTRNGDHLFEGIDDPELAEKAKERGCEALTDLCYKHFLPEMRMLQKAYFEVMTEGDTKGQPFTFPIPTVNVTEEFDWDSENIDTLFENTAKRGSSYFQNFVGSQYKKDENGNLVPDEEAYKPSAVRSMCPLTANTKVLTKTAWEITFKKIGEMYSRANKGTKYSVFTGGNWCECNVINAGKQNIYNITLSNNEILEFGELHLQPVLRDGKELTISAKDIMAGDWLPFNTTPIEGIMKNSSKELGFIIGAYLGDGSIDDCDGINYSFSADSKDDETEVRVRAFFESIGYRVATKVVNNLRSVRIGAGSFKLIEKYITGSTALDKGISNTITTYSKETRLGIIEGLIATDGQRKNNRISTSSENMVESIINLCASVGIKAYKSYEDTRNNRLCANTNYTVSIILDRQNLKDKFMTVNGTTYYKVIKVENTNNIQTTYCVELPDDETNDHTFVLANGLITHNCRLQLDLRELQRRGNGLFGSAESTGSTGVVTINMARLGYLHKGDKRALYKELDQLMDMAKSTLEKKRAKVTEFFERGLYPYTKRYLPVGFKNHFSTIGVNGINEMIRNYTNDKHSIADEKGKAMALEVINHMREKMRKYQEETGHLFNLEASPSEGACYRFAREDLKRYPDIIQAGYEGHNYYTNSSQLPSSYSDDMFEVLEHQNDLQPLYTGGSVLHMYMGEEVSSPQACKSLVKKIVSNYRIPYITITPTFSVCEKHGYITGKHEYCPYCDAELITEYRKNNEKN